MTYILFVVLAFLYLFAVVAVAQVLDRMFGNKRRQAVQSAPVPMGRGESGVLMPMVEPIPVAALLILRRLILRRLSNALLPIVEPLADVPVPQAVLSPSESIVLPLPGPLASVATVPVLNPIAKVALHIAKPLAQAGAPILNGLAPVAKALLLPLAAIAEAPVLLPLAVLTGSVLLPLTAQPAAPAPIAGTVPAGGLDLAQLPSEWPTRGSYDLFA